MSTNRLGQKRSRKGCPECRKRKIKCDERQPRCGQCQRGGRDCHIIDSLFRQHPFTFERNRSDNEAELSEPEVESTDYPLEQSQVDQSILTTADDLSPSLTVAHFEDTQEELLLLRHYSEHVGPWMDLLYRYEVFSREVLTLAREHPILRYAACAVAAKQIGQMRSPISRIFAIGAHKKIASKLVEGGSRFLWCGAKYYERAIQNLVRSITPRDAPSAHTTHNDLLLPISLSKGDLMVRAEGEDPIVRLLGTCILIQYEHLSANRDAWSGHLTGFSKLLDLIDNGSLLLPNPTYEQVYPFTKDVMEVKAAFWNFVVNDLEESFVSCRATRIDTENLALWRNMGALVEDDGTFTLASSLSSLSTTPEHARDKVLSYTLIRLLSKLIDLLAPSQMHAGGFEEIGRLETQFDLWFQVLSPSFLPDGVFSTARDGEHAISSLIVRELWFSNDLCATTMMYYHMARILLLFHRPSGLVPKPASSYGGMPFDLLRAFRDLEKSGQKHAADVISIFRATSCDAVMLRAIQPLYVAARCCTEIGDRRALVDMLRSIQDGLGITTRYRVEMLLEEWNLSYEALGLQPGATVEEELLQMD